MLPNYDKVLYLLYMFLLRVQGLGFARVLHGLCTGFVRFRRVHLISGCGFWGVQGFGSVCSGFYWTSSELVCSFSQAVVSIVRSHVDGLGRALHNPII